MSTEHTDPTATPEESTMDTTETPVVETAAYPQQAPAPAVAPTPPTGPRVATIVWGLVITAIGAGLLAVALGVAFDLELAVIILIAAAGLALVAGSLIRTRR